MINDIWLDKNCRISKPSNSFINQLLINAVVPYLWITGELNEKDELQSKALSILELLPLEKNNIISKWEKINISPKNAFDSQSLLALHRYYCCHKKCLSCSVGKKVLNR